MIFTKEHAQMVVDRRKRQTRRPVKRGEHGIFRIGTNKILSVIGANGRLKWQLGKDYAAQPGRGKSSIGRTPPIIEIRREWLREISVQDCRAEMGCSEDDPRRWAIYLLPKFVALWDSLYRKPHRWKDDPEVWVLVFEHWTDREEGEG